VRALDAEERARALADENGELRLELRRCARALDPVSPRPKRIPPHRPILGGGAGAINPVALGGWRRGRRTFVRLP
jgi:hypothetical protein